MEIASRGNLSEKSSYTESFVRLVSAEPLLGYVGQGITHFVRARGACFGLGALVKPVVHVIRYWSLQQ